MQVVFCRIFVSAEISFIYLFFKELGGKWVHPVCKQQDALASRCVGSTVGPQERGGSPGAWWVLGSAERASNPHSSSNT